jgi:hypothetical protein
MEEMSAQLQQSYQVFCSIAGHEHLLLLFGGGTTGASQLHIRMAGAAGRSRTIT